MGNFFFLIPIILITALYMWRIIRRHQSIPDLDGFSAEEKSVLSRQSLVLLLSLPFLPLAVYAVLRASRWLLIIYLAVSTVILTYVAISSIINRVTALPTRHWLWIPKGRPAVVAGIFAIVTLMIMWAVVLFTDFLQLVGVR